MEVSDQLHAPQLNPPPRGGGDAPPVPTVHLAVWAIRRSYSEEKKLLLLKGIKPQASNPQPSRYTGF
jgi:hypothetical protein